MFALKVKFPNHIFLLRGNHETDAMNQLYGFYEECVRRYNETIYYQFSNCFKCLPLCALIGGRILCMHGGLSPHLTSLNDIAAIQRPCDVPDEGLVCDLLWADPKRGQEELWCPNERGTSYTFSEEVVHDFVEKFDLDLICRAHQVMDDGYEFFADSHLITLFSAPNYGGELDNLGAVLSVDENMVCSLMVLKPQEVFPKYTIGPMFCADDDYDDTEMDSDEIAFSFVC